MARYLFDTNHLSAALDNRSTIRERLYQSRQAGHRFGTCVPALCELETGLHHARHRDHNRHILAVILRQIRVWPLEPAIAPLYAEIFHDLRRHGRVLSQVDMLLAAVARSIDATLLTADRDFDAVPSLRVENWLDSAG
jgi:tRNA(fMet)-specific endonuclease VapC